MAGTFIEPKVTDSAIDRWPAPHYVCYETDTDHLDRLVLFMPGTRGQPGNYTVLCNEAAKAGFHGVNLSYSNDKAIEWEICRKSEDPDCLEKVRLEQLEGVSHGGGIDVSRPNSIEFRLYGLLRYLNRERPDEDWGRFIDGDLPAWEKIVVTGHSQGGGAAALTGKYRDVARVAMFAWCDISRGEVAPWINTETLTPVDRFYGFRHVKDRISPTREVWRAFRLDQFGPEVNVDEAGPPYNNSHMLVSEHTIPEGLPDGEMGQRAVPHLIIVTDDHHLKAADGSPYYLDVWRYLWGV